MNLESIIYPLSVSEFVTRYKGKGYFIHRAEQRSFSALFSWEKLNELLFSQRFNSPRFRLIKDGQVVAPEVYTNYVAKTREGIVPRLNADKLSKELEKGTAIHILAIDEFSPALARLAGDVAEKLWSKVSITMHVGMKNSRGFDKHWDSHDVFVLQVHGRKRWKVYDFSEVAPFRDGPSVKDNTVTKLLWEGDLNEGDVLYLPRGCWHDVEAYDEPCMHISVGMFNPKPTDYIDWLTGQMIQFEFFRKDLPIPDDHTAVPDFLAAMQANTAEFITEHTYRAFLTQFSKSQPIQTFNLLNIKNHEINTTK